MTGGEVSPALMAEALQIIRQRLIGRPVTGASAAALTLADKMVANYAARLEGALPGGRFAKRLKKAVDQTLARAKSPDEKQQRVAFRDRDRLFPLPSPGHAALAAFIEDIEERRSVLRQGRSQAPPGRLKGSGAFTATDRRLYREFRAMHGTEPSAEQWRELATRAGGNAADLSAIVTRMKVNTKDLRSRRKFNSV